MIMIYLSYIKGYIFDLKYVYVYSCMHMCTCRHVQMYSYTYVRGRKGERQSGVRGERERDRERRRESEREREMERERERDSKRIRHAKIYSYLMVALQRQTLAITFVCIRVASDIERAKTMPIKLMAQKTNSNTEK